MDKGSGAALGELKQGDKVGSQIPFTLRIGPSPVGAAFGDYSATLDLTHAAP